MLEKEMCPNLLEFIVAAKLIGGILVLEALQEGLGVRGEVLRVRGFLPRDVGEHLLLERDLLLVVLLVHARARRRERRVRRPRLPGRALRAARRRRAPTPGSHLPQRRKQRSAARHAQPRTAGITIDHATGVVIGETDEREGHAWCIARIDGNVFLLETTGEKEDLPRDPPLAKQSTDKYRAEYLFDRTQLYFFNSEPGQGAGDCWNKLAWKAVDYSSSLPPTIEPSLVEAPWFPSSKAFFAANVVPAVSGEAEEVAGSVTEAAATLSD